MVAFFTISYIISLIIGLVTLLTAIFALKILQNRLRILPRSLRLYLWVCAIPFAVIINLISIYFSVIYLFLNTENHLTLSILRFVITFSAQQIRCSLFFISIERIISTIFFEKYKLSSTFTLFIGMSSYSYIFAVIYTGFSIMTFYFRPFQTYTYMSIWIMFITHANTLIICSILYLLNKRMYKVLIYQITLERRYQIFENVKVLSFIFPPMLIYTLVAPFGSVLTLMSGMIKQQFQGQLLPSCTFHIFLNLSFLLILVQQMLYKRANQVSPENSEIPTIANPFGKKLLANGTSQTYFKQLQHQWNN